jgi:hypothetical protein
VGDRLPVGLDDRHAAVVYSIAASGLAPPGAAFLFFRTTMLWVLVQLRRRRDGWRRILFAGELSVRIANPETYRYVGPDTPLATR